MTQRIPDRIKLVVFLFLPLIVAACNEGPDSIKQPGTPTTSTAPFVAIHYQKINLPGTVRPLYASWSPDGKQILFTNTMDGAVWLINADGSELHCVTCDMQDLPPLYGAFSYIFPDKKKLLVANELGDKVFVVQCSPSVTQCDDSQVFPVDFSADVAKDARSVGRRTYHLAPDGIHLAYTDSRVDTLVMIIGRLEQQGNKYVLKDPKVINPHGPSGPGDDNVEGWANAGQLYEFKSFADGGKSALITAEGTAYDPDTFKMDLATGELTRIAHSPDWDEDGAISPDGEYFQLASWRTMHRLENLGLMPLTKGFFSYPLDAVGAFYYVSSFTGFQCDLQPWLLPDGGDQNGKLEGQPLAPYQGGDIIAANNLLGASMWSPDSTKIMIREHRTSIPPADGNEILKVKGVPPHRLLIAKLDRKPTEPKAAVETVVGDWASTPQDYVGPFLSDKTAFIRGSNSGSISVQYTGNLGGLDDVATYNNYSEDGKEFLTGTFHVSGNAINALNMEADLTVTDADGNKIGEQVGNLHFKKNPAFDSATNFTVRPWLKTGSLHTTYKGKTAAPLAKAGPCLDSLPRPSPVIVTHEVNGNSLQVHVAANIQGDKRPVLHAHVEVNGKQKETNADGVAVFHSMRSEKFKIKVSAGNTFIPEGVTASR